MGAAGSQVGPQAKAWGMWLHYGLGLSFAKCATVLGRLGVNVTAGALCQAAQSTSTDVVAVHADIVRRVNASPAVVMDETGWRVGGYGAWLWGGSPPVPKRPRTTSLMAAASTRPATWSAPTMTG